MKATFILTTVICINAVAPAQPCNTGKLDPRVANALQTVLSDLPDSSTASVEQIRDVKIETPAFPVSNIQQAKITADSITMQIYNPAHATNLPVIISYHPGGFVTPVLPFMRFEFWRQAQTFQAIVFAIDYRVAPENPYPAAVNDAYSAFCWVLKNATRYGGDTSRIIVLGLSAGGNLAAVVCQKAKEEGLAAKIKLQVLNCPSTDNPRNFAKYPSYQQYASGFFLTKSFCQYYINVYAPNTAINNPEVAPVQRNDLSGLPPAVVITSEFDPLRDEGFTYAQRLKKAGVQVWYICFPGQIHCLLGLPPDANELKEADNLVLSAIDEVVNGK